MKERPMLYSGPMVRAIMRDVTPKTQTRRVVKIRGELPPEWATFAKESSVLTNAGTRPSGLFYWSEEQSPGAPLKALRRWPLLPGNHPMAGDHYHAPCPYGVPGDRLWVRETHQFDAPRDGTWPDTEFYGCKGASLDLIPERFRSPAHCLYAASWTGSPITWRPSIFMPRSASRVNLEITGVRVERLQDISEEDAKAEGVPRDTDPCDHTRQSCEDIGCLGPTHRASFCELWDSINAKRVPWASNPWVWVVSFKRISQ